LALDAGECLFPPAASVHRDPDPRGHHRAWIGAMMRDAKGFSATIAGLIGALAVIPRQAPPRKRREDAGIRREEAPITEHNRAWTAQTRASVRRANTRPDAHVVIGDFRLNNRAARMSHDLLNTFQRGRMRPPN
jgi:hypothetical protein